MKYFHFSLLPYFLFFFQSFCNGQDNGSPKKEYLVANDPSKMTYGLLIVNNSKSDCDLKVTINGKHVLVTTIQKGRRFYFYNIVDDKRNLRAFWYNSNIDSVLSVRQAPYVVYVITDQNHAIPQVFEKPFPIFLDSIENDYELSMRIGHLESISISDLVKH